MKLELGARGDPWPTEEKVISPYAAEDFPDFFEDRETTVTVLSARRTFWEKIGDAPMLPDLLDQIPDDQPLGIVTADGA